jgi:hypothetical protein
MQCKENIGVVTMTYIKKKKICRKKLIIKITLSSLWEEDTLLVSHLQEMVKKQEWGSRTTFLRRICIKL